MLGFFLGLLGNRTRRYPPNTEQGLVETPCVEGNPEELESTDAPASPTFTSTTGSFGLAHRRHCDNSANPRATAASDPKARLLGIGFVFFSTLGFSLASVLVQLDVTASGTPFPTIEIAICRAIVGLAFCLVGLLAKGLPLVPKVPRQLLGIALARGALDFMASNLFYIACSQSPIAIATLIYFTNPFLAGVLAKFFLGEPYNMKMFGVLCLGGMGTLVALLPDLVEARILPFLGMPEARITPEARSMSLLGPVAAAVGSVFQAIQYVAGRACSGGAMHWLHQNMAYSLAGLVLGVPAIAASTAAGLETQTFVPVTDWSDREAAATLGIVFCALASQLLLIRGMAAIPATTTASIRTLDIPMAYLWAAVLLRSVPNAYQICGGVILVCACTILPRIE